jgi:23S rRNA pseudouridine955/2504/2580 synthase
MSATTQEVVEDEAGIRLDRWFRRRYPAMTQGVIQKLCRTGQVRVDGRRVGAATRLAPGQSVRIPPLPTPHGAPKPQTALDANAQRDLERMVLYRDEDLIVLNKPSGLPTQGGPGIGRHLDGMLDGLRFGSEHRPRLVHRLDRDTSGVLLLARTPGVAAKLAAAFRGRDVEKIYWAVVAGRPVPPQGRIEVDLVRTRGASGLRADRVALAAAGDPGATHAITDYHTLDHAGRRFAWLELRPLTGRTHQLRVSCAAIGTPILGDAAYGEAHEGGGNSALAPGLPALLHLHAHRLRLPHPAGGWLSVEAPLPAHMAETFRTLGFAAPAARPPARVIR